MSETKARLIGAITVMDKASVWDSIEEEEPDEIDLQMIREAAEGPDCHNYISAEELRKMLQ